jgi:hypothetical protein
LITSNHRLSQKLPLVHPRQHTPSNRESICSLYSRPHDAVIRVYDEAGNVIEIHKHGGAFKEW